MEDHQLLQYLAHTFTFHPLGKIQHLLDVPQPRVQFFETTLVLTSAATDVPGPHVLLHHGKELLPVLNDRVHPDLQLLPDVIVTGGHEEGNRVCKHHILFLPGAYICEKVGLLAFGSIQHVICCAYIGFKLRDNGVPSLPVLQHLFKKGLDAS